MKAPFLASHLYEHEKQSNDAMSSLPHRTRSEFCSPQGCTFIPLESLAVDTHGSSFSNFRSMSPPAKSTELADP